MFDFGKEITLASAMSDFFEALEGRLAGKTSYGISDWYSDLAWGVRLFVDAEVPLFVGKNENTWLTLASEYEARAGFYAGNPAFTVPWPEDIDGSITWKDAEANLSNFLKYARDMYGAVQAEDADWSGPLPSGEKGVNLGEALKLTRIFTDKFWADDLKWSRTPSPNKRWLQQFRSEVMAAYAAMGEPNVGGDLGQQGAGTPGNIPWSMPGQ